MTSTRLREPLFPVRDAQWSESNQTAVVLGMSAFGRLHQAMTEGGYMVRGEKVLSSDLVRVNYVDREGRNSGRCGGANEFVSVYWWLKSYGKPWADFPNLKGNGINAMTSDLETARRASRGLEGLGYQLTAAVAYDAFVYRFSFTKDWLTIFVYFWGQWSSELMFEVVWRDNPGDAWQLWDPNPGYSRTAWHGAHDAESATLDCKKAHPGAEIIIRPTLFSR